MCGVRWLEQWIYSIFSKHGSFFRDGMDSYPCVAPFNGLLKKEQKLIAFDAPFITFIW